MKCIVQLSGGLDSTASLLLAKLTREPTALFVDYGQTALKQELNAAMQVAKLTGVTLHRVTMRGIMLDGGGDYVPVRNFVLGAVAGNLAAALGAEEIWVGNKTVAHRKDDPWCWKDCTRSFYEHMTNAARACFEVGTPTYVMPLAGMSRREVVTVVDTLGASFGLASKATWSCYADAPEPCGSCFHCREGNDT